MKFKECPSCAMKVEMRSKVCPVCQYEFPQGTSSLKWIALALAALLLLYFIL